MVDLAERIAQLSGIPDARVFFTTSGTEANDTALLLATAHRQSNQILAMRNSYHGRSLSAVGITGNKGWSPTSSPLQTLYVHGGVRTGGPYADLGDAEFIAACVDDLKDLLGHVRRRRPRRSHSRASAASPRRPTASTRPSARSWTSTASSGSPTRYRPAGAAPASTSGAGRRTPPQPPDMLTFAKGIGNGMSIGGVVARAEIMNFLDSNSISTFGGSPITMAAGLANLTYLLEHDLQGDARRVGGLLGEQLAISVARLVAGRCAGAG